MKQLRILVPFEKLHLLLASLQPERIAELSVHNKEEKVWDSLA